MGNDSWDWPGAFERAGRADGGRAAETLKPEDFARALRSMWTEHGMLEKSDPRVQEISRSGRLEWWDGRGRCVVLVREGSERAEDFRREYLPPKVGDAGPVLDGKPTVITSIEELRPGLTAVTHQKIDAPPLVVGPLPPAPGVVTTPAVDPSRSETIKAKGKKK